MYRLMKKLKTVGLFKTVLIINITHKTKRANILTAPPYVKRMAGAIPQESAS